MKRRRRQIYTGVIATGIVAIVYALAFFMCLGVSSSSATSPDMRSIALASGALIYVLSDPGQSLPGVSTEFGWLWPPYPPILLPSIESRGSAQLAVPGWIPLILLAGRLALLVLCPDFSRLR